jgi:3'-5' exoribonuclease 1
MRYIIVDLEATCWQNVRDRQRMEIIEIGAVELPTASHPHTREFARFVRPIHEPILSDFCKQLTSIKQSHVDQADTFAEVLPEFLDWIGDEPYILGSWGAYDLNQLEVDCTRHSLPWPEDFDRHINVKQVFAKLNMVKPCGMAEALTMMGLPLVGTHHRGIDDARNIALLANLVLPVLESTGHA